MAYMYATSPAEVVANRNTGQPQPGVRLTIWTARGGQQITAGLKSLDGNLLPGYVESDESGRFPFTDDAERSSALWARTPEGEWYILIADELRDQVGQALEQFPIIVGRVEDAEQVAGRAMDKAEEALSKSTYGATVPIDLGVNKPRFLARLIEPTRVMQCVARDTLTGEWFMSQATTLEAMAEEETPRIIRFHSSGVPTGEEMLVRNAGHGTTIAVERDSNGLWVWMSLKDPAGLLTEPGGYLLGRVKFRNGVININAADIQFFDTFHGTMYVSATLDPGNDWITLRVSDNPARSDFYERRRLSEFRAGIDQVYGTLGPFSTHSEMDEGDGIMQGFATLGDTFWYQTGMGGAYYPNEPNRVHAYSWVTGQRTGTVDAEMIGRGPDGRHYKNRNEPEGISVHYDTEGRATLLFGVTMGGSGDRRHEIWGWTQGTEANDADQINALWNSAPQSGVVYITPPGNSTVAYQQVTYPRPYRIRPAVTCSPVTGRPDIIWASVSESTNTGFRVNVFRNGTPAEIAVYWQAVPMEVEH